MRPPKIQPNVSRDRDPLSPNFEFKHYSQKAINIRSQMQANWRATELRNYVSTIERDMEYKRCNQPLNRRSSHAV